MLVVRGDEQHGTVGEELADPVVVRVTDDHDRPVRGQIVNFRVTEGGGSVFAGAAATNDDGIAQERWTLGTTSGTPQTLEVRAVDPNTGAAVVFATFHAEADPGPVVALASAVTDSLQGEAGATLPESLAVLAHDRYNNAVADVPVRWRVSSGGGSVSSELSRTDTNGIARSQLTLGTSADTSTVTASVDDNAAVAPVTFEVNGVPGPVATLIVSPDTIRLHAPNDTSSVSSVTLDSLGNTIDRSHLIVYWESRNNVVATVLGWGPVIAHDYGQTYLVATTSDSVDPNTGLLKDPLTDSVLVIVQP